MYCEHCGTYIDDEKAIFCPNCGASIRQGERQEKTNIYQNNTQRGKEKKSNTAGNLLKIALVAVCAVVVTNVVKAFIGENESSNNKRDDEVVYNSRTAMPVDPKSQEYENWLKGENSSNNSSQNNSSSSDQSSAYASDEMTGHGTYEENLMPQSVENLTTVLYDDFIYPERLLEEGLPKNAEGMEIYDAMGAWKYEMIEKFSDDDYTEIGACVLDFGQNDVLFDFYPTNYTFGQEIYNFSREEAGYGTYKGGITNGVIALRDEKTNSTIVLGPFYRIEGTEFGFGGITTNSGAMLDILLVRP